MSDLHAKRVLVLNSSEEVLRTVSWQRGIGLLFSERARAPFNFTHTHKIQTSRGVFELPSVLVLDEYVPMPFRHILPTRRNIFARDGYICQYTGEKLNSATATIDHVVPRSKGGPHSWTNVVTCHNKVNLRKGSRLLEQTSYKLMRKPFVPTREHLVFNEVSDDMKAIWDRWSYVIMRPSS